MYWFLQSMTGIAGCQAQRNTMSLPLRGTFFTTGFLAWRLTRRFQRGYTPLAGVWGCPPNIISTPFLARKGVRGMVEGFFNNLPVYFDFLQGYCACISPVFPRFAVCRQRPSCRVPPVWTWSAVRYRHSSRVARSSYPWLFPIGRHRVVQAVAPDCGL